MHLSFLHDLLRRLQGTDRQRIDTLYFFMHIPKTAGTSLRKMLWQSFKQDEVLPNQQDIRANNRKYPSLHMLQRQPERLARTRLFSGHYPYGAEAIFPHPHIVRLTFLRDPIARCFSQARQIKRRFPHLAEASPEQIMQEKNIAFDNLQTRYFCGSLRKEEPPGSLDQAIEALETFNFVGISEAFADSIQLLEKQQRWSLGEPRHANKSANFLEPEWESYRSLLTERNQLDLKLYTHAQQRFSEQCRRYGIS